MYIIFSDIASIVIKSNENFHHYKCSILLFLIVSVSGHDNNKR